MKLGRMRERDRERVRYGGVRRGHMLLQPFLFLCALVSGFGLLMLALRPLDPPIVVDFPIKVGLGDSKTSGFDEGIVADSERVGNRVEKSCATVEEMGHDFRGVDWKETLRVRRIIENHFIVNGASRIRELPPEQFCSHGFVLGKTSEAGFGNEMYKVLTSAALSVMLNRSLVIGQTRHIGSSSSLSFSIQELHVAFWLTTCFLLNISF